MSFSYLAPNILLNVFKKFMTDSFCARGPKILGGNCITAVNRWNMSSRE